MYDAESHLPDWKRFRSLLKSEEGVVKPRPPSLNQVDVRIWNTCATSGEMACLNEILLGSAVLFCLRLPRLPFLVLPLVVRKD